MGKGAGKRRFMHSNISQGPGNHSVKSSTCHANLKAWVLAPEITLKNQAFGQELTVLTVGR